MFDMYILLVFPFMLIVILKTIGGATHPCAPHSKYPKKTNLSV